MLENLFTNVFGRPKSKSSTNRGSQNDPASGASASHLPTSAGPMTGPFSVSTPQMPQPPNLPYPVAPYPTGPNANIGSTHYYPSLPFSQPPSLPGGYAPPPLHPNYPTGTLAPSAQVTPLDSVPFEAKLTLNNSTNLVSLDELFKDIKRAADIVDRADAYLRSSQSDYNFKTESTLIFQNHD